MRKYLLSFFTFLFLFPAWSSSCKLPPGEKIVIGCSYACNLSYKFHLKFTALTMGHSISIVDLRTGDMEEGMDKVDALLLPGGADIDPAYYLPYVSEELQSHIRDNLDLVKFTNEGKQRDPFEYTLMRKYSDDPKYESLPMLGICRGMQMMTVAQGIPLYLDIKTELGIKNRKYLFDRISVGKTTSTMESIYGEKNIIGFKLHHQGLRVPYYNEHKDDYPLVEVTSFSHDGRIAESIEYKHRPALGVQYHPEKSSFGTSLPIFKWLLHKACEYKTQHKEEL